MTMWKSRVLDVEPRTTSRWSWEREERGVRCKDTDVVDMAAAGAGGGSSGKSAAYHSIRAE